MSDTKVLVTLLVACILLLGIPNCGAAPTANDDLGAGSTGQLNRISQEQYEEQQLESLKSLPANENVEISKSQTTKIVGKAGGKVEMHQKSEEKVKDSVNGQTLARLTKEKVSTQEANDAKPKTVTKTELEVPSKGIHRVTVDKKAKQPSRAVKDNVESSELAPEDYYAPFDGVQYTPIDIADYIRRTGDSDGVAMAIEELMGEGLMTKPEADAYLDEVKSEMEFQQHSSSQLPLNLYNSPSLSQNQRFLSKNENQRQSPFQAPQRQHLFNQRPIPTHLKMSSNSNQNTYPQAMDLKSAPLSNHKMNFMPKSNFFQDDEQEENEMLIRPAGNRDMEDDNDYNELIERIRIADFLYKEYSLEEIIYQLAKDMFVQSSLRGTKDAEQSLERFSNFLQEEAAEGRISKELGIRILDVVMAALVDAVGEQSAIQAKSNEGSNSNKPYYIRDNINNQPNSRRYDLPNRSTITENGKQQVRTNLNKESATIEKPSKSSMKTAVTTVGGDGKASSGDAAKSKGNASQKGN